MFVNFICFVAAAEVHLMILTHLSTKRISTYMTDY